MDTMGVDDGIDSSIGENKQTNKISPPHGMDSNKMVNRSSSLYGAQWALMSTWLLLWLMMTTTTAIAQETASSSSEQQQQQQQQQKEEEAQPEEGKVQENDEQQTTTTTTTTVDPEHHVATGAAHQKSYDMLLVLFILIVASVVLWKWFARSYPTQAVHVRYMAASTWAQLRRWYMDYGQAMVYRVLLMGQDSIRSVLGTRRTHTSRSDRHSEEETHSLLGSSYDPERDAAGGGSCGSEATMHHHALQRDTTAMNVNGATSSASREMPQLLGPNNKPIQNLGTTGRNLRQLESVVSQEHFPKIVRQLPSRCVGKDWKIVFHTALDGYSVHTLYQKCKKLKHNEPVLMFIMDEKRHVFGAFLSQPWRVHPQFYGSGESFIMKLHPFFQVWRWSRKNHMFQLAKQEGIGVGAGGSFAFWLDEQLEHGHSDACDTFDNRCPLSSAEDFTVVTVEVWKFQARV